MAPYSMDLRTRVLRDSGRPAIGLRLHGLTVPAVFDGPIDNPSFLAYVDQVLVPTLRPGHVVALDNLVIHKQPAALCSCLGWLRRSNPRRLQATVTHLTCKHLPAYRGTVMVAG